ncbi:hypothetical protein [Providencia phage PSTRCR_121]|nr:hypothetical protein [Providencia phage PSTRCR_121]
MENTMVYDIIEELASTSSTKQKEKILLKYKNNTLLKDVFRLTYSRRVNFYLRKFPEFEIAEETKTLSDGLSYLEDILSKRVLTGHAGIAGLVNVLMHMSSKDVETMRRIINRDLECGVGRSIPNKVWANIIPEQPQCLASPYSDKNLKKITFPAYAQLKADGARCFAEVVDGEVSFFSRAGNEYQGLDSLKLEILKLVKDLEGNFVIDGELVYFPSKVKAKTGLDDLFDDEEPEEVSTDVAAREIGNGIVNKSLKDTISKEEADCIRYQTWDIIPHDVYYSDGAIKSDPYSKRLELLTSIVEKSDRVEIVETTIVNNIEEARKVYRNYIAMKLEGIILKNMNFIWANTRTSDMVKFKEEIDFDLEIVDAYCHSKDPEKIGGVTLRSRDGLILFNCGSGFKDKDYDKDKAGNKVFIELKDRHELDRRFLWTQFINGRLVGSIVTGVCTCALRVEGRDTYSLFLGRIKSLRYDKDEANSFEDIFGVTAEEYFK